MPAKGKYATIFRANFRERLQASGKSLRGMARETGMSQPSLSDVLQGRESVTLDRAERIAEYLQVPLPDLLTPPKPKRAARQREAAKT